MKKYFFFFVLTLFIYTSSILFSQTEIPQQTDFTICEQFLEISKKFNKYKVILKPDKDSSEYWAGAPSVVKDDNGIFWLAARMRSPLYPRGLRGYEIRILKSHDGENFEYYHSIFKDDVPIKGFERPSLLIDPITKKFKLYVCGHWENDNWSILKFNDTDDLKLIDLKSIHPVIAPKNKNYEREIIVREYKDPFIIYVNKKFHCYVTGYVRENERIFHFESLDGEIWKPSGNEKEPVMELSKWHNFFVRPSSVLTLGIGYLFIYEGSNINWYDPVYNIATGIGFTFDLHKIIDLTETSPLITNFSNGDFHTFRYSHWLWEKNEIWIYAEVSNTNNTNEIRLYKIQLN